MAVEFAGQQRSALYFIFTAVGADKLCAEFVHVAPVQRDPKQQKVESRIDPDQLVKTN